MKHYCRKLWSNGTWFTSIICFSLHFKLIFIINWLNWPRTWRRRSMTWWCKRVQIAISQCLSQSVHILPVRWLQELLLSTYLFHFPLSVCQTGKNEQRSGQMPRPTGHSCSQYTKTHTRLTQSCPVTVWKWFHLLPIIYSLLVAARTLYTHLCGTCACYVALSTSDYWGRGFHQLLHQRWSSLSKILYAFRVVHCVCCTWKASRLLRSLKKWYLLRINVKREQHIKFKSSVFLRTSINELSKQRK